MEDAHGNNFEDILRYGKHVWDWRRNEANSHQHPLGHGGWDQVVQEGLGAQGEGEGQGEGQDERPPSRRGGEGDHEEGEEGDDVESAGLPRAEGVHLEGEQVRPQEGGPQLRDARGEGGRVVRPHHIQVLPGLPREAGQDADGEGHRPVCAWCPRQAEGAPWPRYSR
jgi:hypothetical protein